MTYVDIAVIPVPTTSKETYLQHAKEMSEVFKKHGALEIVDCWEDDVPEGEVTSFPKAVKKDENESIVVSWIMWPSKGVRDEAMPKVMKDEKAQCKMPFDGKKMIFGGFAKIQEM